MATAKLFVLGTGRCGTHSLANILGTVPDTLSLHEGAGRLGDLAVDLGQFRRLNCYLYRDPGSRRERIRAVEENRGLPGLKAAWLAHGRVRMMRRLDRRGIHFCESNPYIYHLVDHLHRTFPEARFVHLVRNGYATTSSFFSREKTTYPDVLDRPRRIGWWCAKPFPPRDDPYFAAWERMDRLEKTAWFWQYVNNYIAQRLERLPASHAMTLRIEDLDPASMAQLLDFAGLPGDFDPASLKRRVSVSAPAKKARASDWTPAQLAAFERIAGDTMRRFGYPTRSPETANS